MKKDFHSSLFNNNLDLIFCKNSGFTCFTPLLITWWTLMNLMLEKLIPIYPVQT